MKKLLWVIYLVTWKTFSAVPHPGAVCVLETQSHQEEYQNWYVAASRAAELKLVPENYDVKTWEYQEAVKTERK